MSLGGDVLTFDKVKELIHFGAKGMKWGVRKTPAERAAHDKQKANKKIDKQKFELATRLNGGEVVASALIAGPIGLLGYKAIKHHAAVVKRKNSNLSPEQQTDAAGKLRLGEAIVVTLVSSPVGLITYAVAKNAAAHQVDSF